MGDPPAERPDWWGGAGTYREGGDCLTRVDGRRAQRLVATPRRPARRTHACRADAAVDHDLDPQVAAAAPRRPVRGATLGPSNGTFSGS